jgi:membrane protein DedA with SNARE-associated domain
MGKALAAGAGIVLATEAGVPVPIPADLVLLGLGERAAAGSAPLWAVMLILEVVVLAGTLALFLIARRTGRRLLDRLGSRRPAVGAQVDRVRGIVERRGGAGLVAGRATPGLRTITVVVAALSSLRAATALAALVAGGTVFVQGHVLLGYAVGPAARSLLEDLPLVGVGLIVTVAIVGLVLWIRRRGRADGARAWTEAACPACVAVSLGTER